MSDPGSRRCRTCQQGFSLLEMLLTVAIIGIATAMVGVYAFPDSDLRVLRQDGQRLTQLFAAAHAEARRDARTIVWQHDAQGYAFIFAPREQRLPIALSSTSATREMTEAHPLRPRFWMSPNAITVRTQPTRVTTFDSEWASGPSIVELDDGSNIVRIERSGPGQYRVQP